MCGIVAIAGNKPSVSKLHHAVALLKHRGPDAEGTWVSPSGQCALGHRRLSIIDLSDAGRQRMHSSDQLFHITLNGQACSYTGLRDGRATCPSGESSSSLYVRQRISLGLTCRLLKALAHSSCRGSCARGIC